RLPAKVDDQPLVDVGGLPQGGDRHRLVGGVGVGEEAGAEGGEDGQAQRGEPGGVSGGREEVVGRDAARHRVERPAGGFDDRLGRGDGGGGDPVFQLDRRFRPIGQDRVDQLADLAHEGVLFHAGDQPAFGG